MALTCRIQEYIELKSGWSCALSFGLSLRFYESTSAKLCHLYIGLTVQLQRSIPTRCFVILRRLRYGLSKQRSHEAASRLQVVFANATQQITQTPAVKRQRLNTVHLFCVVVCNHISETTATYVFSPRAAIVLREEWPKKRHPYTHDNHTFRIPPHLSIFLLQSLNQFHNRWHCLVARTNTHCLISIL